MKTLLGIPFIVIIGASMGLAEDVTPPDLRKYVSTARHFAVPESFDPSNAAESRLLVESNPNRFESHLILASALARLGLLQDAIEEFQKVDELSSIVKDREILASLPYEGLYAFTLFAAADKRFKEEADDLHTLRRLQQAIGMDTSVLSDQKRLSQCYMMLATLYLRRGLYDKSIEVATKGIEIARLEGHAGFVPVFGEILVKAREFKAQK